MSRNSNTNRYSINLHDTLSQETCRNNGKDLITHFVVVKNTPFLINISNKDASVNFRKTKISATLTYDCEPRREVTLIRSSPLEYVTHLSSNGELITIEARIHVLTSQNENSLFRVCLKFNEEELITEPLKVISKADNLKKPSKEKPNATSNKKKRTASDAFGDTLLRIEQQQQEQKNLIDMLYQQNQQLMSQLQQPASTPSSPQPSVPSPQFSIPSPQLPISSPSSSDPHPPFSSAHDLDDCVLALRQFLECYKTISCDERPRKARLLQHMVSSDERDTVACFARNFLDMHSSQPPTEDSLTFPSMDIFNDNPPIQHASISSPEHDGYWSSSSLSSPSHLSSPSSPSVTDIDTDIFSELFTVNTDCIFSF
jgi:hypothetical protein